MVNFLVWLMLILIALVELFLLFSLGEHICSLRFRHQYPSVSCCRGHGREIINLITTYYPNAKIAVDIGAGYGRLARAMSHVRGIKVIAIENMWFSFYIMRILNFFFCARNVSAVYADAFQYIKNSPYMFDIGVAYLGPVMNKRLKDLSKKFHVMISLDVEIPDMHATRIVDIPDGGYTHYHHVGKFPHRLYVYEINKF